MPYYFAAEGPPLSPKRGSLLLIAGGVIVLLLLFAGWTFQYMLKQSKLTHRQASTTLTASTANALAQLATHKMQFYLVKDPASALAKHLSGKSTAMGDLTAGSATKISLKGGPGPDFKKVVDELVKPLEAMGQFRYEIHYFCRAADFKPISLNGITNPWPREKKGMIRLRVRTYFKQGNLSSELMEEFQYGLPVKITAVLVPVLSKFTLYVEQARPSGGSDENAWSYNLTNTDQHGNLSSPLTARPIVLKNADNNPGDFVSKREYTEGPRGLVYLGGGKIYLNIARGWNTSGQFAEGFHFFNSGRGDGLYTIQWLGDVALMNWDQGTCYDTSSPGNQDWWDFISASPFADKAKKNSIFRLYGTDTKPSATLVLGEVFRTFICARAFKDIRSPARFRPGFLRYIPTLAAWQDYVSPTPADEEDSIASFATLLALGPTLGDYDKYRRVFASNLAYTPYNLSLAFLATQNRLAFPLRGLGSSDLLECMQNKPTPPPALLHRIPAPYDTITGDSSLRQMAPFATAIGVPGPRTCWKLDPTAEGCATPLDSLKKRGLYSNDTLNLNGWVYIDAQGDLIFKNKVTLVANGGIVLRKGNIRIEHAIVASGTATAKPMLQLVALDGNITVSTNQSIDAALITPKGSVIIGNAGRPTINGAVAMQTFTVSSASQGADINYRPELAALPNHDDASRSEHPLLAISIDPNILILQ